MVISESNDARTTPLEFEIIPISWPQWKYSLLGNSLNSHELLNLTLGFTRNGLGQVDTFVSFATIHHRL